jgi:hypothetical protein
MADDQERAAQALKEMFRRDAIEAAKRGNKPHRSLLPEVRVGAWFIVIFVLAAFGSLFTVLGLHLADQVNANNAVGQFCAAEQDGNYTAAYHLLSQRARAQMTSSDLANATTSAHLLTCSPAQSPWFITLNGDHATISVLYLLSDGDTAGNRDLGTIALVREYGTWRIDTASLSSGNLV